MPAGYLGTGPADRDPTNDSNADASVTVTKLSGVIAAGGYTDAERDALTPSNGWIVYNTTSNKFQGYANGSWVDLH